MGIRKITFAEYNESVKEEQWKLSTLTLLPYEELRNVADEVHSFGLEVEMVYVHLAYAWRIVAIKEMVPIFNQGDWRREVKNGDTMLGWLEWLQQAVVQ